MLPLLLVFVRDDGRQYAECGARVVVHEGVVQSAGRTCRDAELLYLSKTGEVRCRAEAAARISC